MSVETDSSEDEEVSRRVLELILISFQQTGAEILSKSELFYFREDN